MIKSTMNGELFNKILILIIVIITGGVFLSIPNVINSKKGCFSSVMGDKAIKLFSI